MLKSIGKIELLLDDEELILLHQLLLFLTNFKQLTDIVSDANQALCVILLIEARIIQACTVSLGDYAELKDLKQAIRNSSDDRLRISESAKISCICDPSVRDIYDKNDIVFSLVAQMKTQTVTASVNSQLACPRRQHVQVHLLTNQHRQCLKS